MNTHKKPVRPGTAPKSGGKDKMEAGVDLRVAMEAALSAKQMTVSALARDANVQRPDIYKWWRGEQRPSRNTLARVAATLGVEVDYLRRALGEPVRLIPSDPLVSALHRLSETIERLVPRLDALAGPAIRDGVADAAREAGATRDSGEPPASPPGERTE